jgi:hypothetical protein
MEDRYYDGQAHPSKAYEGVVSELSHLPDGKILKEGVLFRLREQGLDSTAQLEHQGQVV